MKIDGNLRSIQSGSVSEGQTRTGKPGASQDQPGSAGGPRVELSPLGSQLAGIEASLAGNGEAGRLRVLGPGDELIVPGSPAWPSATPR